jgi:putative FmdB family regulatory protein
VFIHGFDFLDKSAGFFHIHAMPIYEFHCEKCGADNEILVRPSDWEGTPCPACGSKKLTKKFSTFAASVSGGESAPACSGVPSSCGRCGTGVPHSH